MSKLRDGTRTLHTELERVVDIKACWRSRPRYLVLLCRLFGLHRAFEQGLAGVDWVSAGLDFSRRRKQRYFERDFAALGIADVCERECLTPAVSPIETIPQAMGCLYVLEGSTLGGEVIARQIQDHLGYSVSSGAAFFASYGDQTRSMWQEFSAAAARCCDDAAKQDEAVTAARQTFSAFTSWLAPRPCEAAGIAAP